jgi:hypothetical protein
MTGRVTKASTGPCECAVRTRADICVGCSCTGRAVRASPASYYARLPWRCACGASDTGAAAASSQHQCLAAELETRSAAVLGSCAAPTHKDVIRSVRGDRNKASRIASTASPGGGHTEGTASATSSPHFNHYPGDSRRNLPLIKGERHLSGRAWQGVRKLLHTVEASGTCRPWGTRQSLESLQALRSLGSLDAGCPGQSRQSREAPISLNALWTLWPRWSLLPCGAGLCHEAPDGISIGRIRTLVCRSRNVS